MAHGRKRLVAGVGLLAAAAVVAAGLWMSRTNLVDWRSGSWFVSVRGGVLDISAFGDSVSVDHLPAGLHWRAGVPDWRWTAVNELPVYSQMEAAFGRSRSVAGGVVVWTDGTGSVLVFCVRVALWPLVPLLAVAGGGAVWSGLSAQRRWGRGRVGLCVKCGYDRAGLPAGVPCAECGTKG